MGILKNRIGRALLIIAGVCLWLYFICRFPTVSLFTLLIPPVIAVNFSQNPHSRNAAISVFVVLWLFIFHYESTRIFYLATATQSDPPKFKFLFPPAGWIMFFNVDDTYSHVEVYGKMGESVHSIDPHDIFRTRTFGFDNIHRNILSNVGSGDHAAAFCRYLSWRLPSYEDFVVMAVYYPSLVKEPYRRRQEVLYRCGSPRKEKRLEIVGIDY